MSEFLSARLVDAFWARVSRGDAASCWEWIGPRWVTGYGQVGISSKLPTRTAHRLAFGITHGYLPPVVRHQCDNPPCCNPAHLLPGTQRDNIRDMHERGRYRGGQRGGARHSRAKFTDADVAEMRRLKGQGASTRQLARQFGTTHGNVSKITSGKTYKAGV